MVTYVIVTDANVLKWECLYARNNLFIEITGITKVKKRQLLKKMRKEKSVTGAIRHKTLC